jgi:4-methyl-5(b-hydroxyethyl)-thiazole monophosphate biosynthesis
MVYILLGAGFEEAEALVTADVLRRGNLPVSLVGIGSSTVTGAHGISVVADAPVENITLAADDMVLLPGGMGGVESIEGSSHAMALAVQAAQSEELWLAAICAAPTLLARHNIIGNGQKAVCYPGMEDLMIPAGVVPCMDVPAVRDGRLITGKGPGTVYDFALLILETLTDAQTAGQIRAGLHYNA